MYTLINYKYYVCSVSIDSSQLIMRTVHINMCFLITLDNDISNPGISDITIDFTVIICYLY